MCEYTAEIKLSCGCVGSGAYLDYCDLHRSAPLLAARVERLEAALNKAIVILEEVAELYFVRPSEIESIRQALEDGDGMD